MSESIQAIIQFVILIAGFLTVSSWGMSRHPDAMVWGFRLSMPLLAIALMFVLIRFGERKEVLYDHLKARSRKYFEASGLCFLPTILVIDGICWMQLFYQNRFANTCAGTIRIRPIRFVRSHTILPIEVDFSADGGEFGVVRIPWAIPQKWQGKEITCQVGAATKYFNGNGRELRFRRGIRADGLPTVAGAVSSVALGMLKGRSSDSWLSSSATAKLRMPRHLAEHIPANLQVNQETIWRPEQPTYGFPVKEIISS